jgi:hypothetical protein
VGVAVGGRGVTVAGTGVCVGVSAGLTVAASVGLIVAVGSGVSSGVAVGERVGQGEGSTVLVGVGVAFGGDDTRGNSGQLQATVIIAATAAMANLAPLLLYNGDVPVPCGLPSRSDFRPFKRCTACPAS